MQIREYRLHVHLIAVTALSEMEKRNGLFEDLSLKIVHDQGKTRLTAALTTHQLPSDRKRSCHWDNWFGNGFPRKRRELEVLLAAPI
jgi:tRNA U34 5-methylaminomethyl-2-thiouridine-forming methyltransferase MnmC